jgi:hypothetical protein
VAERCANLAGYELDLRIIGNDIRGDVEIAFHAVLEVVPLPVNPVGIEDLGNSLPIVEVQPSTAAPGDAYSVRPFSRRHHDRFPCKHDLALRIEGIDSVMDDWHVITPFKRTVVIRRKAARNFTRARRTGRSAGSEV